MYGMTDQTREATLKKVEAQKRFLYSHGIKLEDRAIPFASFVKNAFMNTHRYIAELNHRVASIHEYATNRGLANVFVTLTLPSEYHLLKTLPNGKSVKNPKYRGHYYLSKKRVAFIPHAPMPFRQSKSPSAIQRFRFVNPDYERYQPKEGSKELTQMLKRLFDLRVYRDIPKADRLYFRVTEPHHDGTPHVHIAFYLPKEDVEGFLEGIARLYPYPQSEVSSDYIPECYTLFEESMRHGKRLRSGFKKRSEDTDFIRSHIDSPIAYLMKYVLKTLDDLRIDEDGLSDITLWYLYHGISRIYTSRTFIDLTTYRLFRGRFSLIELTDAYLQDNITVLLDTKTRKIEQIYDEHGIVYVREAYELASDDELYETTPTYEPIPTEWTSKEQRMREYIDVYIEEMHFTMYDEDLIPDGFRPHELHDMALYELYMSMEITGTDTLDDQRFVNIHNLCIRRGLIDGALTTYAEIMEAF